MATESSRLNDLVRLRGQLLEWMDEAPADRKAALVGQFRATLSEIEELSPPEQKGDVVDEIAARRSARRKPASGSARPERSG
jgi:hypothetical protein